MEHENGRINLKKVKLKTAQRQKHDAQNAKNNNLTVSKCLDLNGCW